MRARILYLVLLVLLNLAIVFQWQGLFYEKEGVSSYLLIALIAVVNPLLIFLMLKNVKGKGIITFTAFFILAFIHTLIHTHFTDQQLEEHGQEIRGIITDKKWSKGSHRKKGEWLVRAKFEYNKVTYYTFFERLSDPNKNVNDSIPILFSTEVPAINRIL